MATGFGARGSDRYSIGAIVFHWLIAALIAFNYVAAWISEDMAKEDARIVMGNHQAIGISILVLTALRIVWRLINRPPAFRTSLRPWEAALARLTHAAMYVLMIGIPLAGWQMVSAHTGGAPVDAFGVFSWPGLPLAADKAGAHTAGEVHEVLATAMLVLMGIHVLGALKHQWIDRDGSLSRIMPWGAR